MPNCPHCQAALPPGPDAPSVCPACGAPLEDPAGGDQTLGFSPDATIQFDQTTDEPIELELADDASPPDDAEATMMYQGDSTTAPEDSDELSLELADDEDEAPEEELGATRDLDEPEDGSTPPHAPPRLDGAKADDSSGSSDSSGSAGASSQDEATMQFDTEGTFEGDSSQAGSDAGSQTGRPPTPSPREITGLSSGGASPFKSMDGDRGSQSLQASGAHTVGPQNVRLREFHLGDLQEKPPELGPGENADYRFVAGPFAGGMGVVHKARQSTLDRPVAIKQIRPDKAESDTNRNSFVSEAVITGQLEHPNIVPVHDLGLGPDGRPFYAMKFVEGQDWDDCIAELSEAENLDILVHVAQAIAFAHSREVIHMDLKPGNIRIGSFGEVQVMDFGLAARLDDGRDIKPGGTPMYMAPELALPFAHRAMGKKAEDIPEKYAKPGKHSDIYLLGALLFKVITGKAPHTGRSSFDCLRNAARNKIVEVRRRNELIDIAYKAMATEPEDRYATATEFIEAIRLYQAHAQSNLIAKTATRELREAEKLLEETGAEPKAAYASFSRAQHGFQNALDLWPGNKKATRRLKKARRLYAETAYVNGDFDQALSLLDPESEDDDRLKVDIQRAQRQRRTRDAWFKTLQYATAASLVLALAFIALSVVLGRDAVSARNDLRLAQDEKTLVEEQAQLARQESEKARQESQEARAEVERQTLIANTKTEEARRAARDAADAMDEADRAKRSAEVALRDADEARRLATIESYNAAVGSLRATLNDSGAYGAWRALQELPPEVRAVADRLDAPEWNALMRLIEWRDEADEVADHDGPTLVAAAEGTVASLHRRPDAPDEVTLLSGDADRPAPLPLRAEADRIALSPDGRWVALAGPGLMIGDAQTGAPLKLTDAQDQPINPRAGAVAFHPTEPLLLVGAPGGTRTWRIDPAEGIARLAGSDDRWHREPVSAVAFSPEGRLWCSADPSGVVSVWIAGREELGAWRYRHSEVANGSDRITSLAFASEALGNRLAYGCDDGAVYEIEGPWSDARSAPTGSLAWIERRPEELASRHEGPVTAVAYGDGSRLIVSTGGDTMLVQRPVGIEGPAIKLRRRYHDQPILSCSTALHNNAAVAYTSDSSGRVVRARLAVEPEQSVLRAEQSRSRGAVVAARFDPAAGRAVSVDSAGYLRLWGDASRPDRSVRRYAGHSDHREMRAWLVEASGRSALVSVAGDRSVCFWQPDDGRLLRRVDLGGRPVVAVTPSGGVVAAGDRGGAVWLAPGSTTPEPLWQDSPRVSALCLIETPPDTPPTLAVGLRDGQVYLWRPGAGRVDLVRTSVRPHWRAVRALAYDAPSATLYSGDNAGLLAAWRLDDPNRAPEIRERFLGREPGDPLRDAPITRLDLSRDGALIALQRNADHAALRTLDSRIETLHTHRQDDLVDACSDTVGHAAFALDRRGALWRIVEDQAEQIAAPSDRPSSLRRGPEGLLVLAGDGVVQARRDGLLVARAVSRPPALLIAQADKGSLHTLTAAGGVDRWSTDPAEATTSPDEQAVLPLDGKLTAACRTGDNRSACLALYDAATDSTRLEWWDLAKRRRTETLADPIPGQAVALACREGTIAAAVADGDRLRLVVGDRQAGPVEAIAAPLPAEAAPYSLTLGPRGQQVALATPDGSVRYARRVDGAWQAATLDRRDVTALAFTPDGRRLLAGARSGMIFVLSLQPIGGDHPTLATRTLLSFAGHRSRVTTLGFAEDGEQKSLVSGDAGGRLITRPF